MYRFVFFLLIMALSTTRTPGYTQNTAKIVAPGEDTFADSGKTITDNIPNKYIQAHSEKPHTPILENSPQAVQNNDGGFDMDTLFDDNSGKNYTTTETMPTVKNIVTQTQQNNQTQKEQATSHKHFGSESLLFIFGGLLVLVVLGFVAWTMFPLGMTSDTPALLVTESVDETLDSNPESILTGIDMDTTTVHTAAGADIYSKITEYHLLGESYYTMGIDIKNRDMVRYALYIEKKSKDLIEMLDLDPDMDTREIVVYFAQFDDYLQTIRLWENTYTATNTLVSGDNASVSYDEDSIFIPMLPSDVNSESNTTPTDQFVESFDG